MLSSRLVSLHLLISLVVGLAGCGSEEPGGGASGGGAAYASGGESSQSTGGASTGGNNQEAVACPVDLGIPATLRLDEITHEQAVTLCENRAAAFLCTYSEAFFCSRAGMAAARQDDQYSAETCRAAEAECLLEGSESAEELRECSGDFDLTPCPGTVADYARCLQEVLELAGDSTKVWSCDEVSEFFAWNDSLENVLPESCVGFEECL